MADYAIHDTTLIGTSNIIRKKEGSSALIDPADYPKRINLMGMLEEKTIASSAIAVIEDGADDVPTKSVKVAIPASLSGVSAVSVVNSGKNLLAKDIVRYSNSLATLSECFEIHQGTYTVTIGTVANANNWRLSVLLMDGEGNALTDNAYNPSYNPSELQLATNRWRYGSNTTRKDFTIVIATNCYVRFFIELGDTSSSTTVTDSQLELGSTASAYEPYQTPDTYTASLGRTIYGGEVDIVNGVGTDENGNDFTFTGQEVPTRLGYNAFWSEQGDTSVTYRASGTVTPQPIQPTLISKTITQNGTYSAEDDNADGYDEVTVNVPPIRNVYASIASFSDSVTTIPLLSAKCIVTPTSNGISSVVFKHVGKNHVKKAKIVQGSFNTDGGDVDVATTRIRTDNYIPLAAGTYKIENKEGYEYVLYVYSSNDWQTFINAESLMSWQTYGSTFTLSNDRYVRIGWRKSNNANILPSEIHDYILYDTSSLSQITANLGQTIYGGEVDVVNGTGTDEDGNDFTFTGQTINAYSGGNNIYNASGNTEVEYVREVLP